MDNELLHNMDMETLIDMGEKYPMYKPDVEAEIERRKQVNIDAIAAFETQAQIDIVEAKIDDSVVDAINKIFPTKPETITNMVIVWTTETVDDGPPEEVKVPGKKAEMRQPTKEIVVLKVLRNVKYNTDSGKPDGKPRQTKQSFTMKHIEGDIVVTDGNFRNGSEAVKWLGKNEGSDSAPRYLKVKLGYILDDYDGDDYKVPLA